MAPRANPRDRKFAYRSQVRGTIRALDRKIYAPSQKSFHRCWYLQGNAMTSRKNSNELFNRANVKIPGAVNSPVRAWKAVGAAPIFIESGNGATLIDADGARFLDYVCSYGPAILGHACPRVIEAIAEQARLGLGFGAPTRLEVELAELIS